MTGKLPDTATVTLDKDEALMLITGAMYLAGLLQGEADKMDIDGKQGEREEALQAMETVENAKQKLLDAFFGG